MNKISFCGVCSAVFVSLLSGSVSAAIVSQARAQLENLTYTIFDANPTDGLAPTAWFVDPINAFRTLASISIYRIADGSEIANDEKLSFAVDADPLSPSLEHAAVYPVAGAGAAGGAWITAPGMIVAQGQVFDAGVGYSASSGLSTTGSGQISPTFYNLVLGPGTGVAISAKGTAYSWLSTGGEYANASAQLYARFSPQAADGSFQSGLQKITGDTVGVGLDSSSPPVIAAGGALAFVSDSRQLHLSYENLTAANHIGRVRFLASADGEGLPAAVVPEPSTGVLLGLGVLSLFGLIRGRAQVS